MLIALERLLVLLLLVLQKLLHELELVEVELRAVRRLRLVAPLRQKHLLTHVEL